MTPQLRIDARHSLTCADPESFFQSGPTVFLFLVDEGIQRANIDPPAKRHLNGVSLACQLWPKIDLVAL